MAFKLLLMAALVFFDQGGQGQHAATVLASGTQLLVHARLEPFRSNVTNILQYLGTGITFSMAFGGIMLSYMRLAQAEESLRLFGQEQFDSFNKYEGNMKVIRGIIDAVLYTFTILPLMMFASKLWKDRDKIKANAGRLRARMVRLGKKAKRCTFNLANCCGCGTRGMRDYLAAAREEYRRRVEAEEAQREAQGGGEEKNAGDVELTDRLGSVVMDCGNPMRINGGDERAREGGSEADEGRRGIARVFRTGSTAFEEENGENSMNPMVVAEIQKKRDEKRRSVLVVDV